LPLWQTCVALQALPQAPQFALSDMVSAHNAAPESPAQRVVLPEHVDPHLLAEQSWPAGHAAPHLPQLRASELVSTHSPPHITWGEGHSAVTSDPDASVAVT
jgi:hypothetical protein